MIIRRAKSTNDTAFALTLIVFCCTFYLYSTAVFGSSQLPLREPAPASSKDGFSADISKSLFLNEERCARVFPGLSKAVDDAVSGGPFDLKKKPADQPGLVQGRIKDGKHASAILHSLHRAIITSPEAIPDTIFALNIEDVPQANTWSFSRSDDAFTPSTPWLMPHFSSWSWPKPYIGPLDEVLSKIEQIEEETPWESKIDKAVWRGTAWFNPDWSIGLRPKLINVTEGQDWADVEYSEENNVIRIEDFCKYKYIVYAEGTSYSGRLPYHQACASIILTPPPTFLMHNTHLMRPLFSSFLPLSSDRKPNIKETTSSPPRDSYPLSNTATTWPFSYPASLANIIFVQPDWSDLEATIKYLDRNPELAEGIAQRQRELMVDRGYLSEAAETCYWRSLIRGWSETVRVNEEDWEEEEGMRFETYALLGKTKYS